MCNLIDFHSHILPQADDGSTGVEMSVSMLEAEAAQHVSCVVATPHFYANHDDPKRFFQRRNRAEEQLRQALSGHNFVPELYMGAEVAYFRGMSESDILPQLCIAGTNYLLVEMPMGSWHSHIYEELLQIHRRQGLVPILAHVDRYLPLFQPYRIMDALEELPAVIQVNADFFLRRTTARTALRLLREGRIHILGSDCHNLDSRPPNLEKAARVIQKHLGSDVLEKIYVNGLKIIQNTPVQIGNHTL